jgi:hypothetical protein
MKIACWLTALALASGAPSLRAVQSYESTNIAQEKYNHNAMLSALHSLEGLGFPRKHDPLLQRAIFFYKHYKLPEPSSSSLKTILGPDHGNAHPFNKILQMQYQGRDLNTIYEDKAYQAALNHYKQAKKLDKQGQGDMVKVDMALEHGPLLGHIKVGCFAAIQSTCWQDIQSPTVDKCTACAHKNILEHSPKFDSCKSLTATSREANHDLCIRIHMRHAISADRAKQGSPAQAAAKHGVEMFHGFIDKSFRPEGGFTTPFSEMGACVLDKAQGMLHAATILADCFLPLESPSVAAVFCPTDIAFFLVTNLRSCCLGFEAVPAERGDEAKCKQITLPLLSQITEFEREFHSCVVHPWKCHDYRQEFRHCSLDQQTKTEGPKAEVFRAKERKQCIDGMRRSPESAGSEWTDPARPEEHEKHTPLLENLMPRYRMLVHAALQLYDLDQSQASKASEDDKAQRTKAAQALLAKCGNEVAAEEDEDTLNEQCVDDILTRLNFKPGAVAAPRDSPLAKPRHCPPPNGCVSRGARAHEGVVALGSDDHSADVKAIEADEARVAHDAALSQTDESLAELATKGADVAGNVAIKDAVMAERDARAAGRGSYNPATDNADFHKADHDASVADGFDARSSPEMVESATVAAGKARQASENAQAMERAADAVQRKSKMDYESPKDTSIIAQADAEAHRLAGVAASNAATAQSFAQKTISDDKAVAQAAHAAQAAARTAADYAANTRPRSGLNKPASAAQMAVRRRRSAANQAKERVAQAKKSWSALASDATTNPRTTAAEAATADAATRKAGQYLRMAQADESNESRAKTLAGQAATAAEKDARGGKGGRAKRAARMARGELAEAGVEDHRVKALAGKGWRATAEADREAQALGHAVAQQGGLSGSKRASPALAKEWEKTKQDTATAHQDMKLLSGVRASADRDQVVTAHAASAAAHAAGGAHGAAVPQPVRDAVNAKRADRKEKKLVHMSDAEVSAAAKAKANAARAASAAIRGAKDASRAASQELHAALGSDAATAARDKALMLQADARADRAAFHARKELAVANAEDRFADRAAGKAKHVDHIADNSAQDLDKFAAMATPEKRGAAKLEKMDDKADNEANDADVDTLEVSQHARTVHRDKDFTAADASVAKEMDHTVARPPV